MRKKIFLIHGKGKKHGLGNESGGDLDTVSSNAFYAAWLHADNESDTPVQYGVDYEYDFVNYQEGLRHLDVHSGSDLYLPDFPIDALAPSLQMHRLSRSESVDARCNLFKHTDATRRLFYDNPSAFPERWKSIFNDLRKQVGKLLKNRKFYEINNGRFYTGLFRGIARQIHNDQSVSEVISRLEEYLFGKKFLNLQEKLSDEVDSYLKNDLVDAIPQHKVQERLLVFDSSRSDYGHLARIRRASQLLPILVESVSVVTKTYFMMAKLGTDLPDNNRSELIDWTESIRKIILRHVGDLSELLNKIRESNPDHPLAQDMDTYSANLVHFWENFRYETVMDDYQQKEDIFRIHLTEEETGAPVPDIEVVFYTESDDVSISPTDDGEQDSRLTIPTDQNGIAEVHVSGDINASQGVTATYDEMNYLTYPKELEVKESYYDEDDIVDGVDSELAEYMDDQPDRSGGSSVNLDSIEKGAEERPSRSLRVQRDLLQRHIRYLREKDVRLVRLDDHHPYTPEILEKLEQLKDEGVLEAINLSSLPRGEHQPKEDQLCGADLIYYQFIQDSPNDNEGLEELREVTHHQDLHIEPREIGNKLSQLIGSKFSKIEMAEGLRKIRSRDEFRNVLENNGWDEVIEDYEKRLSQVLPRLGKALYEIEFVVPPPDRQYEDKVGWEKYTRPVSYFFGNERERHELLKKLYAENTGNKVRFLSSLSPFCDSSKGEPNINVASALNYLKTRYEFDYFFYAYGSFLLSTRRVTESGYDIDLSKLVSSIGSPADGGHPGAATGSPESNPTFPHDRFGSVNEDNFAEYLHYVMDIVESNTELELLSIREIYPEKFESNLTRHLKTLENQSYLLSIIGPDTAARICVTQGLYTQEDEPDVSMPLALGHLRDKFPMDYFFYSKSSSNLVLRNVDDPSEGLNLDGIARTLGTDRDGGHPRAASCEPRFNRNFPEGRFKRINDKNFKNYVEYLADRLVTNLNFDRFQVKSLS